MTNKKQLPLHSMVTVWLTTIGQNKPSQPEMMSKDTHGFNIGLITEEVGELLAAMEDNDFTQMCDGYFDALWVITQSAMLNGININELLYAGFNSNMSKFCKTEEEADATIDAYNAGTHPDKYGIKIDTTADLIGTLWVIKRVHDGKVMKSINFKEPDFSSITDRLTREELV